jgi:hypothetical protein
MSKSTSLLLLLVGVALAFGCAAPALRSLLSGAASPPIHELWQPPVDVATRDLFNGAGGAELAPGPNSRFEFVEEDTTGASPGYTARDENGTEWDIKLGQEVQPEVVLSRLLWAVGYHQPPTYYVPAGWTIAGAPASVKIAAGPQGHARFRPDRAGQQIVGDWSWYENLFVGTRPFKGLVLANFMLSNRDLKTSNNKIYSVASPVRDASQLYVVRDLGRALGKESLTFPRWLRWRALAGSLNNVGDFEETGFIRRVGPDGVVEFEYSGLEGNLFDDISTDDVVWLCELFARLTDTQWDDAFRAAGYPEDVRARYVRKIKEKVGQGLALK